MKLKCNQPNLLAVVQPVYTRSPLRHPISDSQEALSINRYKATNLHRNSGLFLTIFFLKMDIELAMQQWVEKRNFGFTAAPDNYDKWAEPIHFHARQ